jgi:ribosome biogenesis GTPase A
MFHLEIFIFIIVRASINVPSWNIHIVRASGNVPSVTNFTIVTEEHYDNLRKNPDHPIDAKILKLAVIGIPNAGKSTLINRLMGLKVSKAIQGNKT